MASEIKSAQQLIHRPIHNQEDNTWDTFFVENNVLTRKTNISKDGAMVFYFHKLHELEKILQTTANTIER